MFVIFPYQWHPIFSFLVLDAQQSWRNPKRRGVPRLCWPWCYFVSLPWVQRKPVLGISWRGNNILNHFIRFWFHCVNLQQDFPFQVEVSESVPMKLFRKMKWRKTKKQLLFIYIRRHFECFQTQKSNIPSITKPKITKYMLW